MNFIAIAVVIKWKIYYLMKMEHKSLRKLKNAMKSKYKKTAPAIGVFQLLGASHFTCNLLFFQESTKLEDNKEPIMDCHREFCLL